MTAQTIDVDVAQDWRNNFIDSFEKHDDLLEQDTEVLSDEIFPNAPDNTTLQKVIAPYESATVWLLNSDGPLQVFYHEKETWGETGDVDEIIKELNERL